MLALSSLDGTNGFRLAGEAFRDFSGRWVSSAGDVNGDGLDDLVVGSPRTDGGAGSTYVVFGRAPTTAVDRTGSAGDQLIQGGRFDDNLAGGAGDDALEGRGGADTLDGGSGTDAASYAHAASGVTASLAAPSGNGGDAGGDSYVLIENLTGSRFGDGLTGDGGDNGLDGLDGADTLNGSGGSDNLRGDAGDDSLSGGNGADTLNGEAGATAWPEEPATTSTS